MGRTLDGKYTIQGALGRGGVGVVFRAWQHSMERAVAIKVLRSGLVEDATAVRRFLQEVRSCGRVVHPHVVTAFDFGETADGELYLAMELLEGRTLAELMATEGPLAPARAASLLAGICEGLHAAHEVGLVHRDVKPQNVMVLANTGATGEFVKVLDFGLAKLKSVEAGETLAGATPESITRTGTVCGTPAYMSPEQIMGGAVDRRADVYSRGVMAWEMLAGRLPFVGDAPMRILLGHLHEAPPPLSLLAPQVPPELAALVMRALAKDPAQRPQSAAEFRRGLLNLDTLAAAPPPLAIDGETLDRFPVTDVPAGPELTPVSGTPVSLTSDSSWTSDTAVEAPAPAPSVVPHQRGAAWTWTVVPGLLAVAVVALGLGMERGPADEGRNRVARAEVPSLPRELSDPVVTPTPPSAGLPAAVVRAPAAETPIAPVTGVIHVDTQPTGAEVFADGRSLGRAPLELPAPPSGQVRALEVRLAGFETRRVKVDAALGGPIRLRRLPRIVGP